MTKVMLFLHLRINYERNKRLVTWSVRVHVGDSSCSSSPRVGPAPSVRGADDDDDEGVKQPLLPLLHLKEMSG